MRHKGVSPLASQTTSITNSTTRSIVLQQPLRLRLQFVSFCFRFGNFVPFFSHAIKRKQQKAAKKGSGRGGCDDTAFETCGGRVCGEASATINTLNRTGGNQENKTWRAPLKALLILGTAREVSSREMPRVCASCVPSFDTGYAFRRQGYHHCLQHVSLSL